MRPPFAPLLAAFVATAAQAANFTVDSTTDDVDTTPGDGVCATATATCTLRAAVQESNALAGQDTITLPAGVYVLSGAGFDEDLGATGDLDINDDLTIEGDFAPTTILDGNATDRVFDIGAGVTATISHLTVQNGDSPVHGGGVFNAGTLVLDHVSIRANRTSAEISAVSPGNGGGIYNDESGTLTITDSAITGNGNVNFGLGAAVFNEGAFTASNTTISGNVARSKLGFGRATVAAEAGRLGLHAAA